MLIERVDTCINSSVKKCRGYIVHLYTIPGVERSSAITITSEIDINMSQFGSSKRLCYWAILSPGNNESAEKKKFSAFHVPESISTTRLNMSAT